MSYVVSGGSAEELRADLNLILQDIADRLDKQEGIRGVYRRRFTLEQLKLNDKAPYVGDGDLFYTENTDNVTLIDFNGGFNGHEIWILFRDNNTTLDFRNGNLRERDSNLVEWTATDSQMINAFYADGLWYCGIWDFEVFNEDGSSEGGGTSRRWQFVDIDDDYTVQLTDSFKIIRSTAAAAITITIPPDVLETGDQITIYQAGAGTVTVAEGTDVTINTPSTLVINEQYGTVTLIVEDTNELFIAGRMSP